VSPGMPALVVKADLPHLSLNGADVPLSDTNAAFGLIFSLLALDRTLQCCTYPSGG
jgi:hypothetical protein